MDDLTSSIKAAARLIANADGLIITAGAGMGVDSGLPDFRGTEGFWKAYPALGKAQLRFEEIAHPRNFRSNPKLAWGFYGHRLNLYRRTAPHDGYRQLRAIASNMSWGAFVFTSNVDGHFAMAEFPPNRIVECHGSIHFLQCLNNCKREIWEAKTFLPEVDAENCLLTSPLPLCPRCGALARPNILMFGDNGWEGTRTDEQHTRFREWLDEVYRPVVIEIGAGTVVATVRMAGASLDVPLIRINPAEAEVSRADDVSIRAGALSAIAGIARELEASGFIKRANQGNEPVAWPGMQDV